MDNCEGLIPDPTALFSISYDALAPGRIAMYNPILNKTRNEYGIHTDEPSRAAALMDAGLLAVVALGYSGIFNVIPCGTFGHTWVERCIDMLIALYILNKPKVLFAARSVVWPALWIMLYYAVGYALADRPGTVTINLAQAVLMYLPLLVSTGLALHSRRQWERLSAILQLVAIGACIICIGQLLSPYLWDITTQVNGLDISNEFTDTTRAPAFWMNPNQAAFSFFFLYVSSLWCRIRWLAWLGRLAAVLGVMLTVSRGGLLILAVFTMLYVCCSLVLIIRHKMPALALNTGSWKVILGVGLIIGAVGWLVSPQEVKMLKDTREQVVQRFESENLTRGTESREFLATYWLEAAFDGPWYGQGLRSFQIGNGRAEMGCHNQFIMVLGEVGILGFISYLFLLGVGVRAVLTIRLSARDRLILLLIWGIFIAWHFKGHGLFEGRESFVIWGLLFMAPHVLKENPGPGPGRVSRMIYNPT
jgi:O-antigen ligase